MVYEACSKNNRTYWILRRNVLVTYGCQRCVRHKFPSNHMLDISFNSPAVDNWLQNVSVFMAIIVTCNLQKQRCNVKFACTLFFFISKPDRSSPTSLPSRSNSLRFAVLTALMRLKQILQKHCRTTL